MNTPKWKTVLCWSGSFLRYIVYKIFNIRGKADTALNEILFYGGDRDAHQIGLNNLLCIYYLLLHASRSIDVCVPSLVSDTTAKCLITVQQRSQVRIRIIIHNSDDFHNLQPFTQNGIEVKVINSAERLEHEFILIDASGKFGDAVAVIGSLDYETNRVNCNRDTTLLTSEIILVKSLKREFDRVWYSVADIQFERDDKRSDIQKD